MLSFKFLIVYFLLNDAWGSQKFLVKKNFDTALGGNGRVFGVKLLSNMIDIRNF